MRVSRAANEEDVETVFADALRSARPGTSARAAEEPRVFARSRDGRFVVKQVSKVELECLLSGFAEAYFARLEQAVSARVRANSLGDASSEASSETARSHSAPPPTLLCATLGAFSVLDDQNDLDFVVLENAFYGADAEGNASWRAYDLKGSLRGRYAATRDAEANAASDQRDAERRHLERISPKPSC